MKRLTVIYAILIAILAGGGVAFAAIPSGAVWEIRTTGSDNNGGGYNSARGGTDYSQQDTAQLTVSDLACASSSTTCTSSTGGFTAAMAGNVMKISGGSGFTAGWYEIVSRTDTNTVVVDRAPSSGGGSGGTASVGGAIRWNTDLTGLFGTFTAGNIVWIKAGSYTLAADHSFSTFPQVRFRGYNAARGDRPAGTDRPAIAAGTYAFKFDAGSVSFEDVIITTGHADGFRIGAGSVLRNCKISQSREDGSPALAVNDLYIFAVGSEFTAPSGEAIHFRTRNETGGYGGCGGLWGNYIHDSDTCVMNLGANGTLFATTVFIGFNVFDTCALRAVSILDSDNYIVNNTFFNGSSPTGSGLYDAAGGLISVMYVFNNIFSGFQTALDFGAEEASEYVSRYSNSNAYYNNTNDTAYYNKGQSDITGTNPGFADAAGNDFSIGTNLKAKGIPGLFGSGCTGYLDTGAVQRDEPASMTRPCAQTIVR